MLIGVDDRLETSALPEQGIQDRKEVAAGLTTSVGDRIRTSALPATEAVGGGEGCSVVAAWRSVGLMTSVGDRLGTSAPPVAVAVGGREGGSCRCYYSVNFCSSLFKLFKITPR